MFSLEEHDRFKDIMSMGVALSFKLFKLTVAMNSQSYDATHSFVVVVVHSTHCHSVSAVAAVVVALIRG